ncbi:hypothetical protein [Azospirillum picis]|uniref:Uncharacterized protein n=1 Tax=Azospirillum picis TaxID=488438 RepID=A0ABU0MSD0_9PROT|nr:hypothetical protein [Azospirillum picis]MBP2301921.1 hypothetical protein [Azospirillum picis]MDQ0536370.1 hypothetical protein [Azospirillum picis]
MLHIKDIEAFARINEALNEDPAAGSAKSGSAKGGSAKNGLEGEGSPDAATGGPAHPALVMAMLATGRLPLSAMPKTSAPSRPEMPAPWGRLFRRS